MATRYHVMVLHHGVKEPDRYLTRNTREAAEVEVRNLSLGGVFRQAWIETECDALSPIEQDVQRTIEREAGGDGDEDLRKIEYS